MDREIFIQCLKNSFKWLIDLGYSFSHIESSVFLKKRIGDDIYSINFFWAEYDVIKIQGLFAYKGFGIIENIIEKKTGKLDFTIRKRWEGEIPKEFYSRTNGIILRDALYLSNEKQIGQFSELVKLFYKDEITPFYYQFSTFENVLCWLSENDIQDHSKLIVVNNNTMMLRKLIIMREGRSKDFDNLYKKYREFLHQKSIARVSPYPEMYHEFTKFDDYFVNHTA